MEKHLGIFNLSFQIMLQNIMNSVIPPVFNILLSKGNHDCTYLKWMLENYHDKLFFCCQNVFFNRCGKQLKV